MYSDSSTFLPDIFHCSANARHRWLPRFDFHQAQIFYSFFYCLSIKYAIDLMVLKNWPIDIRKFLFSVFSIVLCASFHSVHTTCQQQGRKLVWFRCRTRNEVSCRKSCTHSNAKLMSHHSWLQNLTFIFADDSRILIRHHYISQRVVAGIN